MEQYETHRELLNLPPYVFPIGMVVFGYPTQQQKEREYTSRFDEKFIVFENRYRRLGRDDFDEMFANGRLPKGKAMEGIANIGQLVYVNKFGADFSIEMRRSVQEMLKAWAK
jgi:choline dehydrogenase-like flavoprotein